MRPGLAVLALVLLAGGTATAQQIAQIPDTGIPVFRVDVVSRTIKVVNFHHRQGSTEMDLTPTSLAPPKAEGSVRIDSRSGATKVEARVNRLNPPQSLGEEYLTYVLWAITPEGRPENLGELGLQGGDDAKVQAATELQSFGLMVTAEPYFAVTQPSDAIVLEASVGKGTTGTISPLEAKYELWPRGMYAKQLPEARRMWSKNTGKEAPPALAQAQHALVIAKAAGAERYAADTVRKAEADLLNAEAYFNNKGDLKRIQTLARNVTQFSEDARLISMKKAEEERLEAERKAAADRLSAAKTAAEMETRRRELAESERILALERETNAKLMAEQEKKQRERAETEKALLAEARAAADQARLSAEAKASEAAARAEQAASEAQRAAEARAAAEAASRTAIAEREQLALQKAEIEAEAARARELAAEAQRQKLAAEQARAEALAEQEKLREQKASLEKQAAQARADAERADQARRQAELERTQLREQLREQLNSVLMTRETARGLIVNLSDVLFDTGKHALRPAAREKLARVSGIITAHPGLKLEVEGHTDSVGGDAFNQGLSERRAGSVREFLLENGVQPDAITAVGFGETRPAADNATAAGRQQNRRVEIVVSGESIQAPGGAPPTAIR
ncbi:MAG: OmpA family protein [Bryobacteraceae bacterium]